jgi:uncharacterized protein (TIGR02271 family)
MPDTAEAYEFHGRTVVDQNGQKIGKIDELYYDQDGGQPEWALVNTGMFGTKKTFVPIAGSQPDGDDLRVAVAKDQVKDAPRIDAEQELSESEERTLFEHYGVPYTTEGSTTAQAVPRSGDGQSSGRTADTATGDGRSDEFDGHQGVGHDTSGPNTDEAMTRSEEELRVGTTTRESGRARLRKYVVTEHVTQTVPVQREEVRIEREPITDANRDEAVSGPDISEEEHEVVLHEEQPVVEKQTVAKERVRLDTETVTDEQEISEEVRKERIDTDGIDRPAAR